MTANPHPVLGHLRRWLGRSVPHPASDAELLGRFAADRDEAAFAALVDRHGPMVLGVARRIVGDHHLAEDVFQATFLTLARWARRLRHPNGLPAWLHRTAYHLAVTALRARRRRDRAEAVGPPRPTRTPVEDLSSRELLAILDEELRRLPEVYRLPLILCCLEGRSQEAAAQFLGWTSNSVRGRLERGRRRLQERLARRGLTFAVGAGMPLLLAPPAVAATLRDGTLRAVLHGSSLSATVSALVHGAAVPSLVVRWPMLLLLGLIGVGSLLASMQPPAKPPVHADADPPASAPNPVGGDPLPEGAVNRFGAAPLRIGTSAFALTPDGKTIVTVSPEGIVRTFDAGTGRLLEYRRITDRTDVDPYGQSYADLSPDGRTVVTYYNTLTEDRLRVWDVSTGRMLFRHKPYKDVYSGASGLSPDGTKLALCENYRGPNPWQRLQLFDLKTGQKKELGKVEFNIHGVCFTADGKRVVLSESSGEIGGENTFACFDAAARKLLWRLPRKGQEFAISPDGRTLVSATMDQRTFQVIDMDPVSGKPTESSKPCHRTHPNVPLVIAPDNRTVVMSHFEEIVLWNLEKDEEIRRIPSPRRSHGYGPELAAVSADGRTLVTNRGSLQRWDLTTGKPFFDEPPDDGLGGPVVLIAFAAGGREVVASSWSHRTARWDVRTGKQLNLDRQRFGHQWVSTPAGLRSVGSDFDHNPHEITLYDPLAGQKLETIRWADSGEIGINGLRAFILTTDGTTLVVAHGEEPGVAARSYVTVCDVASERRRIRFTVPKRLQISASPFSPCGRWGVLDGKVYHLGTGTALFTPVGASGERLVQPGRWGEQAPIWFSGDGRLVAAKWEAKQGTTAGDNTLAVWELATAKVLAQLPKAGRVGQVAFAPDGRTLAFVDGWGITMVDLLSGKRLAAYGAPDVTCDATDRGCATQTLVFAPDGRTLATGHRDGTVVLWKVPQPPEDPARPLTAAACERLWTDLGSDSPTQARAAVQRMARRPAEAVPFLAERFRADPVAVDPALAPLLADLDSDVFATRQEAVRRLHAHGAKAETALRRELERSPSPKKQRRILSILAALPAPPLRLPVSGETLRGVRALEVLERTGTPEARRLLQAWAEQGRDPQLAAEARAALGR